MNITDEMLYAAAPEAAERWLDTLPGREDCGHNFSLTFEASMAPILRRRRKRRWRTLALLAAVIAALAALLVTVGAERKDDYRVYAAQEDGFISYLVRPRMEQAAQDFHPLTPGWLPEGYALESFSAEGGSCSSSFRSAAEGTSFRLDQWSSEERSAVLLGNFQIDQADVGGEDAIWIANQPEEEWDDTRLFLWTNGPYAFILSGGEAGLDLDTAIRIAENLKW
ncbi:DUF4367 domain-containing protein [uncultured Oscillibacter sp.]|uniref:DUF4367 domain-containing protein n=1 Tax=uncultured Oscillibacter sp. TaxID=876091 RepID=UPI00272C0014|nr:DUF4367 domain-containing protein [uncultured Oscillibacter sp.]